MELNEKLKKIERLNNLVILDADLHADAVPLNYNEMTFIPEFSNSKLNAKQLNEDVFNINSLVYQKIGVVSSIKNTHLDKITSLDSLLLYMPTVYPKQESKFGSTVSSLVELNRSLNMEWKSLLYDKINANDGSLYDDTLSINDVYTLDDQYYKVMELGNKLVTKHTEFNTFLNTYYNLLDELSTSFIHVDDRNYLIQYIDNYVKDSIHPDDLSKILIEYEKENKIFQNKVRFILEKHNPDFFMSHADLFIREESNKQSDNKVETFLNTKILTDNSVLDISFTTAQKIDKVFLFKDKSIAYRKNNEYHTIKDNKTLASFTSELYAETVSYLLRKKPKSIPFFHDKMLEDKNYGNCIKTVQSLLEHHLVLKQYDFDLNTFKNKDFEAIDDYINNLVYKNKIKQFAYSILSSKYKHHFNDETEPHFKTLYDNNVTTSQLQTFVGRKIAALKDNEDVINMLTKTLNHFDQFTQEDLTAKLESFGIKKIYDQNNIVTFEVQTHDECSNLGSSSWCIARDLDYFQQYVTDVNDTYTLEDGSRINCGNRQYIMYDFNKSSTDIESMIGFTIRASGSDYASHYKNDDSIRDRSEEFDLVYKATLYANKERHVLDNETIEKLKKQLGIVEEQKNNKLLKQRIA